ncbi:MAG: universal stress protein, partial [Pseudomonadota bacterium]
MVCLDGSPDSDAAADLALEYARSLGQPMVAAHVYDARIHTTRFRQMEPGLPRQYQDKAGLKELRDSHGTLMSDGFNALSRGYMERFLKRAGEAQIEVEAVVEEGRNYVGLGKIIGDYTPSMVVAGASGLGDLGDRVLGSTVSRLLRSVSCDLLIGRASAPTRSRGPVLTGIDGSGDALEALKTAIAFANMTRSS